MVAPYNSDMTRRWMMIYRAKRKVCCGARERVAKELFTTKSDDDDDDDELVLCNKLRATTERFSTLNYIETL